MAPPNMAQGSNSGKPSTALIIIPTKNIPVQSTKLKKTPSPVSTVLTGTKFDPKNTTAIPQHSNAIRDTILFYFYLLYKINFLIYY